MRYHRIFWIMVMLVLSTGVLFSCGNFHQEATPTAKVTQVPTSPPTPTPTATSTPIRSAHDIALLPPMGWNSFNRFGCNLNEALIKEMADILVSSGMQKLGYQYMNIDDCWMTHDRDNNGNLQADPVKFPGGIQALADYVHSKGLKLGIYLDRGTQTCAGYPGSYGYEVQDANLLASWGIDYLKYDNCNPVGNFATDYINMHDALEATGRPIIYSMCTWGFPGYWALDVGQLWRTTSDIQDNWSRIMTLMDANNVYAAFAGPGHWNDPDMLEVGNGGMSDVEYRTHFTMWAIMAAPLIAGNDLRSMDQATLDILTAPEVIAIDQDPLGIQGTRVDVLTALNKPDVWSKTLSGANTRAVALLNRSEVTADITVNWSDIGLPLGSATVRDLWARMDLGSYNDSFTAQVIPHGVVLVKIVSTQGTQP